MSVCGYGYVCMFVRVRMHTHACEKTVMRGSKCARLYAYLCVYVCVGMINNTVKGRQACSICTMYVVMMRYILITVGASLSKDNAVAPSVAEVRDFEGRPT